MTEIIPQPVYQQVSNVSVCDPLWSMSETYYEGGYYYVNLYYNGILKRSHIYFDESKTIDIDTLRIVTDNFGGYKVYCMIYCSPPVMSFDNVAISENGVAEVQVTLNSGKESQKIDFEKTEIFGYDGTNYIDLKSQLNSTLNITQTSIFKWQIIENGNGYLIIKLANTCGYILDYIESDILTYIPPDPCEGITCLDYCDDINHIKYTNGYCVNGECVYDTIEENSVECGYIPPEIEPPIDEEEPEEDGITKIYGLLAGIGLGAILLFKK